MSLVRYFELVCGHIGIPAMHLDLCRRQRFLTYLNIRVDEKVQRRSILLWREHQISSGTESDAVLVEMPEVIGALTGILVGL